MKNRSLKLTAILLVIGLVAAVAAYLLTAMVRVPAITEHDFNYSAEYTLNGETKTVEGVYRAAFRSTGMGTDPLERYYEGTFLTNESDFYPGAHMIAQQDDRELCIMFIFTPDYFMGDADNADYSASLAVPYLAVCDREGFEYTDEETVGKFGAELVSWEIPDPIENSFVFVRFSGMHTVSMIATLVIGVLLILAVIIFVKRDKSVPYKVLDKISIALNALIGVVAIPFTTFSAWLMQIIVSGDEWAYQASLCLPALIAFTIAASIALRRRGYTKIGFLIQFIGPVLFVLFMVIDPIL